MIMMSATRDEILTAALELSESDRLAIVNRLLQTLPADAPDLAEDDPDFAEELERRSGDWDSAVPWDQLRDELRSDP
jgi:putative addiction module component (TIGR02574 family)